MIAVWKMLDRDTLKERFQRIAGCGFEITHVSFPPLNCHFSNSPFWKLQYAKLWQQFRKMKSLPTVCDICLKIIHLVQNWQSLKWVKQWNVCMGSLFEGGKSIKVAVYLQGWEEPLSDYASLNGYFLLQFHVWFYVMIGILNTFVCTVSYFHLCSFSDFTLGW